MLSSSQPSAHICACFVLGAKNLIKFFNIDDISWQQEMDLIEKLIEEAKAVNTGEDVNSYDMNHLTGLRYRLKVVGDNDHPVRELGVQHRDGTKMSKMKMVKKWRYCCCVYHCLLTSHERSDVSFDPHKV